MCNTSPSDGEYLIMSPPARFANTPYLYGFSPPENVRDVTFGEDASIALAPRHAVRDPARPFRLLTGNDWYLLPIQLPCGALHTIGGCPTPLLYRLLRHSGLCPQGEVQGQGQAIGTCPLAVIGNYRRVPV